MKIDIMTLFPEMIMQALGTSIIGRALEKESISLAKKFEKTCEKLIQDMKKYL